MLNISAPQKQWKNSNSLQVLYYKRGVIQRIDVNFQGGRTSGAIYGVLKSSPVQSWLPVHS